MKQETIKTIAVVFSQFYGETVTPEEMAVKMFSNEDEQRECAEWFNRSCGFQPNTAQYITANACRNIQYLAAREYVAAALNGKARKIVALNFPCSVIWCESSDTGITDPYSHDLPEYARIDRQTGALTWSRYSDLLTAEQRKKIIISASVYNPNAVCC